MLHPASILHPALPRILCRTVFPCTRSRLTFRVINLMHGQIFVRTTVSEHHIITARAGIIMDLTSCTLLTVQVIRCCSNPTLRQYHNGNFNTRPQMHRHFSNPRFHSGTNPRMGPRQAEECGCFRSISSQRKRDGTFQVPILIGQTRRTISCFNIIPTKPILDVYPLSHVHRRP